MNSKIKKQIGYSRLNIFVALSLIVVMTVFINSCSEEFGYTYFEITDCDAMFTDYDCLDYEPNFGYLTLHFNKYDKYEVVYMVYKGEYIEDGILVDSNTVWYSEIELKLAVNEKYAVKAIYTKDGESISVVNQGEIITYPQYVSYCDDTCWHYVDDNLSLDLK